MSIYTCTYSYFSFAKLFLRPKRELFIDCAEASRQGKWLEEFEEFVVTWTHQIRTPNRFMPRKVLARVHRFIVIHRYTFDI